MTQNGMASLISPGAVCIRSLTIRPSSAALRGTRAFYSTTRPLENTNPRTTSRRPVLSARKPQAVTPPTTHRQNSTSTPVPSNTTSEDVLTWDRFFQLRNKRWWVNLGASVVTAAGTIVVFGPVLAAQDIDGWASKISGLDPLIVLGLTGFAMAGGGWLCGPSFGTALFKLWAARKGWNGPIAEKEKSLYARIKRYRADPSASSLSNPIPDYYGEKIGSVKGYRSWLKDQRAFNRKRNKNML